jgi:para-nitrobenzyl esterase
MIFDEFDIHPEKESQRKIIDWDRTYFLTKYYCILQMRPCKLVQII